jgi:hypothetical protein
VDLIDALKVHMGPEYSFQLNRISEGGIVIKGPGERHPTAYKCFRFRLREYGKWPQISDDTMDRWRLDAPMAIWSPPISPTGKVGKIVGFLFLKAFHGAPVWTPTELQHVAGAFADVGIRCTGVRISVDRLTKVGDLGV